MIAVGSVVFGILIGYLRGGRLELLAGLRLRGVWLLLAALVVQFLIFPTPWWSNPPVSENTGLLYVTTYGLAVAFLVVNRRQVWPAVPGMALNLTVIIVNRGFMPADPEALLKAGRNIAAQNLKSSLDHAYANLVMMSGTTRFNLLGDRLYLPAWVPLATTFSIGDLLLMVGIAWLIQSRMVQAADKG